MKRIIAAALFALMLPLGACSLISLDTAKQQAQEIQQAGKPRQRVETLALQLKAVKEGLGEERRAGHMTEPEFRQTFAAVDRADVALTEAGRLLETAAQDQALADSATTDAERAESLLSAGTYEALAIQRTRDANADIKTLRATLNRLRGVPVAVAVPTVK